MQKRILSMFPACHYKTGFLYLVGGFDGLVKVGRTKNLTSRLRSHRSALGSNFAWCHAYPIRDSGKAEQSVKWRFKEIGRQVRNTEVFYGISREVAILEARELVFKNSIESTEWRLYWEEQDREEEAYELFKAQYLSGFDKATSEA